MMHEEKHIDELLMAYLLNELDSNDIQKVELWLSESDENQAKYNEVIQIWDASQNVNEFHFDADKAWEKVSDKIEATPFYTATWLRVAAAILVMIGATATFYKTFSTVDSTELYAENEMKIETLIDGSVITLNENSSIKYLASFNEDQREISLEGEAFFDIERDETKPFIINLNHSKVTVLGTSFNIKSETKDELVRVFVKSGVVLFEYLPNDSSTTYLSIELHAGDKVVYNNETNQLEAMDEGSSSNVDMYWINKELVFDGIALHKVAKILEVVYDVEISFTEEQSKECLLTANFQNAEIDQIMVVISTTFELELTQTDNHYVLKGLSCEEN
jgi:ferric-dicitrate binding protein FerR (iron transport regulator)